MISGNVPKHLLVAARTGFLATATKEAQPYTAIAEVVNMDAKSIELVDVGAAPMPSRNLGRPRMSDFIEKNLTIEPLDWDITVWISHNAVQDDQTGQLEGKTRSAGENFQLHMSNLAFQALNDGDATTNFGACYDGLSFYNDSHVDSGAYYTTTQDNKYALAISMDNFETVRVAGRKLRQDQGEFVGYDHSLIVTSPENERVAANIAENKETYDTANREMNPYANKTQYIVSPQLDSTAWILVAQGIRQKPILVVIREQPNLQSAWFDPEAADGGRYYFKFYARYNHYYGDWRTAMMGQT